MSRSSGSSRSLICTKINLDFRIRSSLVKSGYEAKYTLYEKGY